MKFTQFASAVGIVVAAAASSTSAASVRFVNSTDYFNAQLAQTILAFNNSGMTNISQYFDLNTLVSISFPNFGVVPIGGEVPLQTAKAGTPTWYVNTTNNQGLNKLFDQTMFTAMIIDTGTYGVGFPNQQVVRHYLANNLTLSGSDGMLKNMTQPITPFNPPNPPPGSGLHRYVELLWAQPANFQPPANFSTPQPRAGQWDFLGYIRDANLTKVVGANFFLAQNNSQSLTVSPSPTSSVQSAQATSLAASLSSSITSVYGTSTTAAAATGAASSARANAAGAAPVTAVTFGVTATVSLASLLAASLLGAVLL